MNQPSRYVGTMLKAEALRLYDDGRGVSQRDLAERAHVSRERMGQVLSREGAHVPRGRKDPRFRP